MTEDALNTAPPGGGADMATHSLPQEVNGDTSNGIDTSALASGGPMRSLLDVMLERQNELASKRKTKEAMVKSVAESSENAKVSIRNSRRDAVKNIRAAEKSGMSEDESRALQKEVQEETDAHVAQIVGLFEAKKSELRGA